MGRRIFQLRRLRNRHGHSENRSSPKASLLVTTTIYLSLLFCVWAWVVVFTNGQMTIGGVPTPVVVSFLNDSTARNAYFKGDREELHARLQEMDVEERVKAFYRPQIPDEAQLDQHIHQILYERTGYVGQAYRVNSQGVLVLKQNYF